MIEAPRVLVADDDAAVRQVCRAALEMSGCEVVEAADGTRAASMLESTCFSLILTDVMMPGENGLQILEQVSSTHPDTLVILITGYGSIEMAKKAIIKGAFDFITKPFRIDELVATAERALEVRRHMVTDLRMELSELHDLTSASDITSEDLPSYVNRLCRAIFRSFRADAAAVFLDPAKDRPAAVVGESLFDDRSWASLARLASSTRDGLLMERGAQPILYTDQGTAAVMGLSLRRQDRDLGACLVARVSSCDPFTERDLKLLKLFQAHAANQITNYQLTEDLKRAAGELERVNLLTSTFSSSLDTTSVLEAVGQGMRDFMPFEVLGVFLAGQGVPSLGYVLADERIPFGPLKDIFSRNVSPVTGREEFEEAWKTAAFETFGPTGPSAGLEGIEWKSYTLGEQGTLRGVLLAGMPAGLEEALRLQRYLPILAGAAVAALGNAHMHQTGERNYIQTISALAGAVDAKDPYTNNHSRNVTAYVLAMADYLGLPDDEREELRHAALLHDIGKIGVPEAILNKPGSLTEEEYGIICTHPDIGCRILSPVTALAEIPTTVRHHHERFDGRGYPDKLAGEAIPYHARILAVADVLDAMTTDRIYRPAPGLEYAISELRSNAGSQFDPSLAYAFIDVLSQRNPEQLRQEYGSEVSR